MKKLSVYVCLLAFGVVLTSTPWTPVFAGDCPALVAANAASPEEKSEEAETFTGRIAQVDGKYILDDSATKSTFQLDDQEKAKAFEGRTVKVTGTLDASTRTIHVKDIRAA